METKSNTYSAGAILDYLPDFVKNVMEDLTIYPQHNDTKHRGGISFKITLHGKPAKYEVIHNFGDLFDLMAYDVETGQLVDELNDLFAGDFINLWEMWINEFGQYFEEE